MKIYVYTNLVCYLVPKNFRTLKNRKKIKNAQRESPSKRC